MAEIVTVSYRPIYELTLERYQVQTLVRALDEYRRDLYKNDELPPDNSVSSVLLRAMHKALAETDDRG